MEPNADASGSGPDSSSAGCLPLRVLSREDLGEASHVFSHIRRRMLVDLVRVAAVGGDADGGPPSLPVLSGAETDGVTAGGGKGKKRKGAVAESKKKAKRSKKDDEDEDAEDGVEAPEIDDGFVVGRWMTEAEMDSGACPVTLKKAFRLYKKHADGGGKKGVRKGGAKGGGTRKRKAVDSEEEEEDDDDVEEEEDAEMDLTDDNRDGAEEDEKDDDRENAPPTKRRAAKRPPARKAAPKPATKKGKKADAVDSGTTRQRSVASFFAKK
ncbi:hypothetical protein HK101_003801 [Irineochytrium annulatum]|nr:hypothetical protein HK101_003801 [Irineochytrium annulatum]